jgi:hypothetical protein
MGFPSQICCRARYDSEENFDTVQMSTWDVGEIRQSLGKDAQGGVEVHRRLDRRPIANCCRYNFESKTLGLAFNVRAEGEKSKPCAL